MVEPSNTTFAKRKRLLDERLCVFAGCLRLDEFGGSIHLHFGNVTADVALDRRQVSPHGERRNGGKRYCDNENNGSTSHVSWPSPTVMSFWLPGGSGHLLWGFDRKPTRAAAGDQGFLG